jgi:hypothetical protein
MLHFKICILLFTALTFAEESSPPRVIFHYVQSALLVSFLPDSPCIFHSLRREALHHDPRLLCSRMYNPSWCTDTTAQ